MTGEGAVKKKGGRVSPKTVEKSAHFLVMGRLWRYKPGTSAAPAPLEACCGVEMGRFAAFNF
jgi:hypothetical protein